LYTKVNVSVNA